MYLQIRVLPLFLPLISVLQTYQKNFLSIFYSFYSHFLIELDLAKHRNKCIGYVVTKVFGEFLTLVNFHSFLKVFSRSCSYNILLLSPISTYHGADMLM